MRLFVAIPLASAVIDELSAISRRLKSGGDGLRWTAPATWHITLQFLGETSRAQCECVVASLHELHLPPVPIRLEGLGCFERAGVFFAGVKVSPELVLLEECVVAATALCGLAAETRPFQPHITLARSKGQRQSLGELKTKISRQPEFTRFTAGEFLLIESFLGPGGSRYEVRARFPLNSG